MTWSPEPVTCSGGARKTHRDCGLPAPRPRGAAAIPSGARRRQRRRARKPAHSPLTARPRSPRSGCVREVRRPGIEADRARRAVAPAREPDRQPCTIPPGDVQPGAEVYTKLTARGARPRGASRERRSDRGAGDLTPCGCRRSSHGRRNRHGGRPAPALERPAVESGQQHRLADTGQVIHPRSSNSAGQRPRQRGRRELRRLLDELLGLASDRVGVMGSSTSSLRRGSRRGDVIAHATVVQALARAPSAPASPLPRGALLRSSVGRRRRPACAWTGGRPTTCSTQLAPDWRGQGFVLGERAARRRAITGDRARGARRRRDTAARA